jgi:hypothetical protein
VKENASISSGQVTKLRIQPTENNEQKGLDVVVESHRQGLY